SSSRSADRGACPGVVPTRRGAAAAWSSSSGTTLTLEVSMTTNTTQATGSSAAEQPVPASVPMRFEVTTLPVSDVDRAKAFYLGLGWHLDVDLNFDEHARVVQFTPTGSAASIQFGSSGTTMTPGVGSLQNLYLIVDDIVAAREDLIRHGAEASEI